MAKWLLIGVVLSGFLMGLFPAHEAFAVDPVIPVSLANCTPSQDAFISPIVDCLTSIADPGALGILPLITKNFLQSPALQNYFKPLVNVMILLVIVFYGYKITLGDVHRPKADTLMLIFKIAGVSIFLNDAPNIYLELIAIVQALTGDVSTIATSAYPAACNPTGGDANHQLWARWDCIFGQLFGFGGASLAVGGIVAFLFLMFVTMGTGILIFFVALYFLCALFFSAARFVHMYVMAIFSLSFIFILGYLFVPLLLFKFTGDYFRKWLNICFGYMLMPVILMAYMAMMLVALDVTLFTGPFALWRQVSPAGFDANNNPFSAAVNQTYQALNVNKDDPTINKPVTPFYVDMMETFQIGGNPVDAGTLGQLTQDPNYTGTAYRANAAANANNGTGGVMPASVPRTVLNLTGMAGAMPDHSVENYVVRILTSFCVAALLAYIMYSMLSYIPNLASDLVSQGSRGSMGAVAKTEVFAEALVRGTIEATKEIAIAAALAMATGGTSLAASGGKVAAEQTAKQMLKKSAVRIAKQQAQQAAQRRAAASKSSDGTS